MNDSSRNRLVPAAIVAGFIALTGVLTSSSLAADPATTEGKKILWDRLEPTDELKKDSNLGEDTRKSDDQPAAKGADERIKDLENRLILLEQRVKALEDVVKPSGEPTGKPDA